MTGGATASTESTETNNVLTIFIYPGKDFAESAASLSTFIQSHTLTPGSCHTQLQTATRTVADCNPPSSSAEANTMLRSLLVGQSNNCIRFWNNIISPIALSFVTLCYYSAEYMDDSTVQAHGYWRPLPPHDMPHTALGHMDSGNPCWWEECWPSQR